MRSYIKVILAVFLTAAIALSAVSCGGIKRSEAKEVIGSFFTALEANDFKTAKSYLHPTFIEKIVDNDLTFQESIENLQKNLEFHFSDGVEIKRYTSMQSAAYDSNYDGSYYGTTMELKVGDKSFKASIIIVSNEKGYGIYNFGIQYS